MEFKVFEDKSGAFVFSAPGSKETADKFDLLVEAFEDGRIHRKRMIAICERLMREVPPLLRPYHVMATIHLARGKHEKALMTAARGLEAVNDMFPDDFSGPIPWHHDGNRPYLDLLKTILLCHIASKDFEKAADWCGMIERAEPDDCCGVRFVMGHVLLRSGEVERAQSWFIDHGMEYAPYYYELGVCHFRAERYVAAVTAFRRGIAINPYIAEMIFNDHEPNPYAVMHFWSNETPMLASQYLGTYSDFWDEAQAEQRFLFWLFNHSLVLGERAKLMACREQRSMDFELPQPKEQVAAYRELIASIDDSLSRDIARRRPNASGVLEWPWESYR